MSNNNEIHSLDVVALLEDLPSHNLLRGHVGTVVERLNDDVFEVEFSDNNGRTFATVAIRSDQLIVLYYNPARVA